MTMAYSGGPPWASASSERLEPALAALEHRDLLHAERLQELDRFVICMPDLPGDVRVRGKRDRATGLEAHLEQRGRRVDLPHRLSETCCRDLDRHVGLGDPVHRSLVEAAQVAVRPRRLRTPHLYEVGMAEH